LRIKRIYHPYEKWEEYHAGMWRKCDPVEEQELLPKAVEFTGDYKLYGSFMREVITNWPFSCEHNLSDLSLNRKAWIGHAATTIGINCPEYLTRLAWWQLTPRQQGLANIEADNTIKEWEMLFLKTYTQHSILQLKIFSSMKKIKQKLYKWKIKVVTYWKDFNNEERINETVVCKIADSYNSAIKQIVGTPQTDKYDKDKKIVKVVVNNPTIKFIGKQTFEQVDEPIEIIN
jgi:hypothetical protein